MSAVAVAPVRGSRRREAARSVRRGLGRIPRAALLCALLAGLNGVCWSLLTPPFQSPDEPEHFAYVKQLAETGRLPESSSGALSPAEIGVLTALGFERVREQPEHPTISTQAEQDQLERELLSAEQLPEKGSASAGVATAEPPLYYALETIPYRLAGGTLLDRLAAMRLLSALLGAMTALFVFLFLREALPGVPWAWTVGTLAVALAPLLGFMSGSVNPDALLYAVCAALFFCLARAFRVGLTPRLGLALGVVTALGLLTKLNFLGLLPGVLAGLAVLGVRAWRLEPARAARTLAVTLGVALTPGALYLLLVSHPALGVISNAAHTGSRAPLDELSYIWQLYLPRLPGMHADFRGLLTARQIWFDGYVGLYGWLDTAFPAWVYDVALLPAGLIGVLCLRELLRGSEALRGRLAELAVYACMSVGLLVLVGASSYASFPEVNAEYGQARYLLALLPLLGAVVALGARGAGRRWGVTLGAVIVALAFGHDLFSQLQLVARYYG